MGDPFVTPLVYVNSSGFGPTSLPERFTSVPYVTYSKWERLGRVANFGNFQLGQSQQRFQPTHKLDDKKVLFGGALPQVVTAAPVDDDYELVDTVSKYDASKKQGPRWNVRRGGFRGGRGGRGGRGAIQQGMGRDLEQNQPQVLKGKQAKFMMQGMKRGKQWGNRRGAPMGRRRDDRDLIKEASIKIRPDWELVEQFEIPQISKLAAQPPTAQDIFSCGELRKFDDSFDKITTRSTKPLKLSGDTSFVYAGTLEDPVIEKFIEEKKGTVFATDEILSYLMTIPRSAKTWDLVFTRVGDVLFIDKRDDAQLEVLTVNETFTDRIAEKDEPRLKMPYNAPDKLALEATAVHQSFLCQVLKKEDPIQMEHPNPFSPEPASGELPRQPISYTYRTWKLGAHTLVARTELHAVVAHKTGGQDRKVNIYTLNEFDSRLQGNVDWRLKLDNHYVAVLAKELKNNGAKIARWTAQSILAGADSMKVGFVSRVSPTDPTKHVILGVNTIKPRDLAQQIALSERNMWGVLETLINNIMSKGPGKYLMVRDPNKPVIRLYSVPMSTFEESEDEGFDEDETDEEEDGEIFENPDGEEEM